jgi:hypothetical protein
MDGSGGFQGERVIDAASSASNVYVPIAIPETARSIILRNTAAGHERSEIIFDTPAVVSDRQQ